MKMETMMEEGEEDYVNQEETDWNYELDITQLCRICANPNEYLIPIFHGEGLEHELKSKISRHLPIKVAESDKLPTNLCYQCASTLIAWHDMVVGCLEADEKLRALLPDDRKEAESGGKSNTEGKPVQRTSEAVVKTDIKVNSVPRPVEEEIKHEVHQVKLSTPNEVERVVVEEEVTSFQPEFEEEVTSDSKEEIVIKEEEVSQVISVPLGGDVLTAVEMYEDVETSVVLHDFVDGLEEGQYIAYIDGDEYVESSVEVMDQEMEEHADDIVDCKPYMCTECGKIFTNIILFRSHLSTHQNKGHLCSYCDANYKRIDHLQKHIELMHPDSNIIFETKEKKVNPYAKTFLCNICGKILKSSIAYENHTLRHQSKCPFPCDLCPETFPNRGARRKHEVKVHNILTKENGNTDGYHICEICGLEMFSDGAYYHHKDKHGDPYPCPHCGKLYGSRSLMQVHARRHTDERPYVCSQCNRNFKMKQELSAHMNIHKDVRPYPCPHCPKMCRKSSDLTHHIRTHTGEKPYVCDKCGRGFAQAGDMRKHRQLHFRPSKINKKATSSS